MPEVSVIVPVYNAEEALQRCIDSILNQEFKDLELILLNDGSRDGSGDICDAAAEKDPRVKVIHKTNTGVSDTRNMGIGEASGAYIQFLDADDWIPEDSTKMLVRTMKEKKADLVVGNFYRVVGGKLAIKGSIPTDEVLSLQEYAEYMKDSPADYYYGVIWNKLYRRDIIEQYHVRMDAEVRFCEDFIFNLEYLLHCSRIAALQVPVYYYVKTDGSLVSQNLNPNRLINMKTSVYQYYDNFFRKVLNEEDYRSERIHIASFLISAATDEFVNPLAPGTKKVGSELPQAYLTEDRSLITQSYYLSKLYERYLNTIAIKNNIDVNDVKLFSYILLQGEVRSMKEFTNVTGLSEPQVIMSAQRLALKKYIRAEFHRDGISLQVKEAEELIHDLRLAEQDLTEVCFDGFSEDERKTLVSWLERITDNLKERLRQ